MNRRTQFMIAGALLLLGLGVLSLGWLEDEDRVRQVQAVLDDPAGHQRGSYTVVGIPQPPELPVQGGTEPNPDYEDTTSHTVRWTRDGTTYLSRHTVRVEDQGDAVLAWTWQNRTHEAGNPGNELASQEADWTTRGQKAFLIEDFEDPQRKVWGVFGGSLAVPMQPKPSQFEGRLATPGDVPGLPADALVFQVDEYTAGCSSKFLPPGKRDEYDPDGDGVA